MTSKPLLSSQCALCVALSLWFIPTAAAQETRPFTPTTFPETQPAKPDLPGLDNAVAEAHGVDARRGIKAVEADILVEFGGEILLEGTMLYDPHGNRVRMELLGGTDLIFDGEKAWVSPATDEIAAARFHLQTWPYFLAAPFKLGDPGANLGPTGLGNLQGKAYRTARLTFDPETGDAPDDWYVVYADLTSSKLGALAYIVTYGKSKEEAEAEPHAITYHDFGIFNGLVLAKRWQFWSWTEEDGIQGEPVGQARLKNIRFPDPPDDAFERPRDSREDKMPTAE